MGKGVQAIYRRLHKHINENNIIIPEPFVFEGVKNAELQAARVVNIAKENFNKRKFTSFTALDLEIAYDTVWWDAMVYKLEQIHNPDYVTKIISSYINDRTIQVTSEGKTSNKETITAGLPQGRPSCFHKKIRFVQPLTKIKIENTDIGKTESLNYLGITLDRKLSLEEHVKNTAKKACAAKAIISPYIQSTNSLNATLRRQLR